MVAMAEFDGLMDTSNVLISTIRVQVEILGLSHALAIESVTFIVGWTLGSVIDLDK